MFNVGSLISLAADLAHLGEWTDNSVIEHQILVQLSL